jgi:hypothetical protein
LPRVFQFIALTLLAVWFPATQHCNLEAVGWFTGEAAHAESAACCDTAQPCAHGSCAMLETGVIKPTSSLAHASAPCLFVCQNFVCPPLVLADLTPVSVMVIAATEHPHDELPRWPFARRAAPLARAPSRLS